MKTKICLIGLMCLNLATPTIKPADTPYTYKMAASDFGKAVLAGIFIKSALKLATSRLVIFGHEIHKKSDSTQIKLLAEAAITVFEILRRDWDGTADCCNSESFNTKIMAKLIGKVVGMRIPLPFYQD